MNLDIKIVDANDFLTDITQLNILKKCTLDKGNYSYSPSGMNIFLNTLFNKIIPFRKTTTQFLMAYYENELVGLAIISNEPQQTGIVQLYNYKETDGNVFMVYVEENCRKFGIAKKLLFLASAISKMPLLVIPWDPTSYEFYKKYHKQLNLTSVGFKFQNDE